MYYKNNVPLSYSEARSEQSVEDTGLVMKLVHPHSMPYYQSAKKATYHSENMYPNIN